MDVRFEGVADVSCFLVPLVVVRFGMSSRDKSLALRRNSGTLDKRLGSSSLISPRTFKESRRLKWKIG